MARKSNNTDVFERYDNIADFRKALKRPEVGYMYDKNKSTVDFYGTNTHDEADELLTNGDTFTAKIVQGCNTQKKFNRVANTVKQDFCGFVPNVGAALTGHPVNMFNVKQATYKNTKVLSLIYFVDVAWYVDKKKLAEAGAKLLNVINTLEARGYRLNLFMAFCSHPEVNHKIKKDKLLNVAVKIKDSGKHLNITKIAYPIAHPSFLRRHCFLWVNTAYKDATNILFITDPKELAVAAERICKGAKFVGFRILSKQSEEDILKRVLS